MNKKRALVIGANYGLLLAGMLIERNFDVEVFGTEKQVETLRQEGFSFNMNDSFWKYMPSNELKFINSFTENNYDLAILAVQEPTLSNQKIAEIISLISKDSIPILSIMNIPLLSFLKDVVGIHNINNPEIIYSSLKYSNLLNSKLIINCNPEPQIFSKDKFNHLNIRLGGVFRCSSLNMLSKDIILDLTKSIENGLPAKIKSYRSPWVSLSKLPMLMTGNYRCLSDFKLKSIFESVYQDTKQSEIIYNQVIEMMKKLGAGREAIIPFKFYLRASVKLDAPSSVCRSIVSGNQNVERVDKLVQSISKSIGYNSPEIDKIVNNIDESINFFKSKNNKID